MHHTKHISSFYSNCSWNIFNRNFNSIQLTLFVCFFQCSISEDEDDQDPDDFDDDDDSEENGGKYAHAQRYKMECLRVSNNDSPP